MQDAPITIRAATEGDIDALVGLLGQLFEIESVFTFDAAVHRRGLEALISGHGQAWVWVALSGDTVSGMCTAQRLISTAVGGPVLHVEDVVVDSARHGAGIGSALMAHVERWAVENGYRRLQLVADGANTPAITFYRNRNWEKTNLIWHRKHLFRNAAVPSGQGDMP